MGKLEEITDGDLKAWLDLSGTDRGGGEEIEKELKRVKEDYKSMQT